MLRLPPLLLALVVLVAGVGSLFLPAASGATPKLPDSLRLAEMQRKSQELGIPLAHLLYPEGLANEAEEDPNEKINGAVIESCGGCSLRNYACEAFLTTNLRSYSRIRLKPVPGRRPTLHLYAGDTRKKTYSIGGMNPRQIMQLLDAYGIVPDLDEDDSSSNDCKIDKLRSLDDKTFPRDAR